MSNIKAFQALHPLAAHAAAVTSTIEEMSLENAKEIRKNNSISFIHLLAPEITPGLSGDLKKEAAFKKINENLDKFLSNNILVQDTKPTIYIYRVLKDNTAYTGIWACTSIDDYASETLKRHELIKPEREEQLSLYLKNTGIDANPVLITYHSDERINGLISTAIHNQADFEFRKESAFHSIWKIDNETQIAEFIDAFSYLDTVYIADGHHRAAAAWHYGSRKRTGGKSWKGDEEYNYFSSVYIADNQLDVCSFDRVVKIADGFDKNLFLKDLGKNFSVCVKDDQTTAGEYSLELYLDHQWYQLEIKDRDNKRLMVSILHEDILEPMLGISNSGTDSRIDFVPGKYPRETIEQKVNSGEFDVAFVLHPISTDDLMKVADSGEVMPPKSTWFEPKFPVGLLIHKIESV